MRILTVVSDLGIGGTQRVAQNYAMGYADAGHHSAILGYAGGGPRADVLRSAGLPVFAASREAPDDALREALLWRPDVVHIHREGNPDRRSGEVARRFREETPRVSLLETNVFSRADRTPDGSLFDLHLQLTEWCLWKWTRWTADIQPRPLGVVVPNAVDAAPFFRDEGARAAFRVQYKLPLDAVVVGRIGQPIGAKWHRALISSFVSTAQSRPNLHLLVIGFPADMVELVDNLPAGIRRRVHVHPPVHGDDALRGAYNAVDVFAHAAKKGESFGMVLTEAMLCEVPVLTLGRLANDNSQSEVVGHGVGGLVAANEAAFSEALATLVDDSALRKRLGAGGRERVLARYTLERVMPVLLRLVEAAVSAPSRSALHEAILADRNLITNPDAAALRRLRETTVGRYSLLDRALSAIVHVPWVYRGFRRLKGR